MQLTDLNLQSVFPYRDIFNPSITRNEDGSWLLVCRLQNQASEGFLGLCTLDKNFIPLPPGRIIRSSPLATAEVQPMLEDPRSFVYDGKIWLTHVESSPSFLYFCYTVFGSLDEKGELQNSTVLDYKKNKKAFDRVKQLGFRKEEITLPQNEWLVDKNWQFFIRGNKYYCIYQAGEKNEIFQFEFPGGAITEKFVSYSRFSWNYGRLSGGASPVLHEDGYYYSFFHSWTAWSNPVEKHPWQQRKYHIGVYLFESTPPFRMKMISTIPLLSGSDTDRLAASGHSVVFPGSAHYDSEKKEWILAIGWNDHSGKILRLEHQKITAGLQRVKPLPFTGIVKKEMVPYIKKMRGLAGSLARSLGLK